MAGKSLSNQSSLSSPSRLFAICWSRKPYVRQYAVLPSLHFFGRVLVDVEDSTLPVGTHDVAGERRTKIAVEAGE